MPDMGLDLDFWVWLGPQLGLDLELSSECVLELG